MCYTLHNLYSSNSIKTAKMIMISTPKTKNPLIEEFLSYNYEKNLKKYLKILHGMTKKVL